MSGPSREIAPSSPEPPSSGGDLARFQPSGAERTVSVEDVAVVIAIEQLVKDYQGLRPLRVRHLVVRAGDRVAISGLDATAAEVFINLVNGAILPDQGHVEVFGRATADIADEAEWLASLDRFGIVSPRAVLLEASTVRQNMALPFTIDLEQLDGEVRIKTGLLAEEVGLPASVLDQPVARVAVADRMRIHLARALATTPQILLLEHPTAQIPREAVPAFTAAVARAADARRLTVLAVTEDATLADEVATSHVRLQGGTGALVNARGWRSWF